MADSSWDTYTPAPRRSWRRGGPILAGFGAIALAVVLFVAVVATLAGSRRRSAWPLVLNVAARLQTDEQARDLYRRNPALSDAYADEAAFLDQVRTFRAGLRFPDQAPGRGREYRVASSPFALRVQVKGEGDTWMEVRAEFGNPFGPAARGEGITHLVLAQSQRELLRTRQRQDQSKAGLQWTRFAELAAALAAEGGPGRIHAEARGLRTEPADLAAFDALARRRADALRALPREQEQARNASIRIHGGPFRQDAEIAASLDDGGRLRARWESHELVFLELK